MSGARPCQPGGSDATAPGPRSRPRCPLASGRTRGPSRPDGRQARNRVGVLPVLCEVPMRNGARLGGVRNVRARVAYHRAARPILCPRVSDKAVGPGGRASCASNGDLFRHAHFATSPGPSSPACSTVPLSVLHSRPLGKSPGGVPRQSSERRRGSTPPASPRTAAMKFGRVPPHEFPGSRERGGPPSSNHHPPGGPAPRWLSASRRAAASVSLRNGLAIWPMNPAAK